MLRPLVGIMAHAAVVLGASLQEVTDFGSNPTGLQMFTYIPDELAASRPVVVAVSSPRPSPPTYYIRTQVRHRRPTDFGSCMAVSAPQIASSPKATSPATPTSVALPWSTHKPQTRTVVGPSTTPRHSHAAAEATATALLAWSTMHSAHTKATAPTSLSSAALPVR